MEAIERIDREVKKHMLLVADLRARKNSFLPVFRLPSEILANIFVLCSHNYYLSFCVPDWVNVSYVCRHWRDVALNCPTLWADHFTVSLRWTEELLARSKQASLKIYIGHESHRRAESWWSDLLGMVLNHAERIQQLRIYVPGTLLPAKLSLYAPRLQILDISTFDRSSHFTISYGDIYTPLLQTLKLTSCTLPWHSLDLNKVTTLVLCSIPASPKQNLTTFLSTLNRMPALTVLHLEKALATVVSGVSPKVNLPHLTRLLVAAPLSEVVALLSCINIPSKTQVRLEIEILEEDFVPDDYAQLLSLSTQRFSCSDDPSSLCPKIRSVVVHSTLSRRRFTVSASERKDCDPQLWVLNPPRDCNVSLAILIGTSQSMFASDRDRIIGDICCSIPPTHVQILHVVKPPSSDEFWRRTLGHLSGLRYMQLSAGYVPDLAPLLTFAGDESLVTPESRVTSDLTRDHEFVPALQVLMLHSIKFVSGDGISQESLLHALSTRKYGCPRLSLINCTTVEEAELPEPDEDSDVDSLDGMADDN